MNEILWFNSEIERKIQGVKHMWIYIHLLVHFNHFNYWFTCPKKFPFINRIVHFVVRAQTNYVNLWIPPELSYGDMAYISCKPTAAGETHFGVVTSVEIYRQRKNQKMEMVVKATYDSLDTPANVEWFDSRLEARSKVTVSLGPPDASMLRLRLSDIDCSDAATYKCIIRDEAASGHEAEKSRTSTVIGNRIQFQQSKAFSWSVNSISRIYIHWSLQVTAKGFIQSQRLTSSEPGMPTSARQLCLPHWGTYSTRPPPFTPRGASACLNVAPPLGSPFRRYDGASNDQAQRHSKALTMSQCTKPIQAMILSRLACIPVPKLCFCRSVMRIMGRSCHVPSRTRNVDLSLQIHLSPHSMTLRRR